MASIAKITIALKSIDDVGKLEVEAFNALSEKEREVVQNLYAEDLIGEALTFLDELDEDRELEFFMNKIAHSQKEVIPFWRPFLGYAALFLGFVVVGYLLYAKDMTKSEVATPEMAIKLKTGEDNVKVIRQGESKQIFGASGEVLGEQQGNKLQYSPNSEIDELVYNELEIPFGMIFDVELSDGTLVHLNSGTKMRYPVKFLSGQKREVFIAGEAYLKVAKDKEHPFVVHAEEVAVEVLGTEFNFSSYREDNEITTVLVEGSVRMSNSLTPNEEVVLLPGTEGTWDRSEHDIKTQEVDVELFTSWIKGELVFRNASFAAMEKKLERSYNVTIQNNNLPLANKMLNARFHVNIESIDEVMKSIGELYAFEYDIQKRRITIN